MFLAVFVRSYIDSSDRRRSVRRVALECDECGVHYDTKFRRRHLRPDEHHFCQRRCLHVSRKSGVAAERARETCLRLYGASSPLESDIVRERIKDTIVSTYGVDNVFKSREIVELIKKTKMDRYNDENFNNTKKIKRTKLLRHGDENFNNIKKAMCTNLERHGYLFGIESAIARERAQSQEAKKKRHDTIKERGLYDRSRAEQVAFEKLNTAFNKIERHAFCNGWEIDLFVEDMKTYVQIDGVFWHGLDRHLEEIIALKNKLDSRILMTHAKDRKQDAWFNARSMRLARITDKEALALSPTELVELIKRRVVEPLVTITSHQTESTTS